MKRLFASNLSENVGQKVLLKGWLHSIRPLGKINFVIVRDCTGLFQVVLSDKHAFKKISALQPGSVLAVIGTVIASEQADLKYEIVDAVIDIMVPVEAVPPVEYYKPAIPSDLEHILDFRSISLRNRQIAAVFKIQAELAHAYRVFMHDNLQATEYFGPNVIGASSEGGAEFFSVDYFGQTATLAQSSQLYKQMMVGAYEKVYAIMPFFRAENSNTTRHLTEGKQFEFEMGFFDSWTEIMDVQEDALRFMLGAVAKNCASQLATLEAILPLVTPKRFTFSGAGLMKEQNPI